MTDILDDLRDRIRGHTCYDGCMDRLCRAYREIVRLRDALREIAEHAHNAYDTNGEGQYGIGVTDGHRCAASIARAALDAARKEKP